jgi:hypothetical protein
VSTSRCARRARQGKYRENLDRLFPPSIDEKLRVIEQRLIADCEPVLDHAFQDQEHLDRIYRLARDGRRLVRSCW